MGSEHDRTQLAYDYLFQRSRDQTLFTIADVAAYVGWSEQTVKTYVSKHWADCLIQLQPRQYRVKPDFQRITSLRFRSLSTQKKNLFSAYERLTYSRVMTFEFLLPLTCETELRSALDELFYADTLLQRLREVGVQVLDQWERKQTQESEEQYLLRVTEVVAKKFTGYSLGIVDGRFRGFDLSTRAEAAGRSGTGTRYLVDEKVASVRFIIPIESSEAAHGPTFDSGAQRQTPEVLIRSEIALVREVFLQMFAEPAVRTVSSEDEIWLIESSPDGSRLYVWRRPAIG